MVVVKKKPQVAARTLCLTSVSSLSHCLLTASGTAGVTAPGSGMVQKALPVSIDHARISQGLINNAASDLTPSQSHCVSRKKLEVFNLASSAGAATSTLESKAVETLPPRSLCLLPSHLHHCTKPVPAGMCYMIYIFCYTTLTVAK